jgi:hypothetical protein
MTQILKVKEGGKFMEQKQFVAVQKNADGDLTAFKTSDGSLLSYEEALQEVLAGSIANVSAFKGKDGETYIRSNPDNRKDNNLDQLPLF